MASGDTNEGLSREREEEVKKAVQHESDSEDLKCDDVYKMSGRGGLRAAEEGKNRDERPRRGRGMLKAEQCMGGHEKTKPCFIKVSCSNTLC